MKRNAGGNTARGALRPNDNRVCFDATTERARTISRKVSGIWAFRDAGGYRGKSLTRSATSFFGRFYPPARRSTKSDAGRMFEFCSFAYVCSSPGSSKAWALVPVCTSRRKRSSPSATTHNHRLRQMFNCLYVIRIRFRFQPQSQLDLTEWTEELRDVTQLPLLRKRDVKYVISTRLRCK